MWRTRPPLDSAAGPDGDRVDAPRPDRPDWLDSFTLAADLGLLGICVLASILPVLTAGAGVATASVALEFWLQHRRWPGLSELAATFRRALLPGILATVAAVAVAAALTLDIAGVAVGAVPGGRPVLIIMIILAMVVAGIAALTVVEVGRHEGRHWYRALKIAGRAVYRRPILVFAIAGTLVPPVIFVWAIPITVLVVPGFTLFAVHVVDRRLRLPADS